MASAKLDDMGVSRSGRVRKKSSKLLDYESSEESEVRPRKAAQATPKVKSRKSESQETPTVPPLQIRLTKQTGQPLYKASYDGIQSSEESEEHSNYADKLDFSTYDDSSSHIDDLNSHTDDFDNDEYERHTMEVEKNSLFHDHGDVEEDEFSDNNFEQEVNSESDADLDVAGASGADHIQSQSNSKQPSLYLLENARKKMIMKDGKLIAARQKAQRKDKGKTRFTAYMLWSKEMRPVVSSQHPDLKFEGVSKRLGELWSTVSPAERMTWKRRAMKMASKVSGGMISTGAQQQSALHQGARVKTTASPKRNTNARTATKSASPQKQLPASQEDKSFNENDSGLSSTPTVLQPRSHELEPLDVATHLHLLGESLSLIGARLKERDGQIAVSGSLSVLLDSMLCALGPLLCLTRLAPETNGVPPETLSRILDNIAYIMPGL